MKLVSALRVITMALAFLVAPAHAQDSGIDRLKRISTSVENQEDWLWTVRQLDDPVIREGLRQALATREEYPRKPLVSLLTHPQLAVRLGSLELLEQAAGNSFEFNPWSAPHDQDTPPNDPNLRSLKAWQDWAGLTGEISSTGLVLTEEQMQAYLRDIISGNSERKRRAIRMLDPHSMKAVAAIQVFITANPGLPTSSNLNLKEAQYQLVIARTSPKTATVMARDLTRGNRDQQLSALSSLKKTGFLAIPIVRDFIDSQDPLVRETAIDTILALGGSQTVPLVAPSLKEEKDTNVIHAAMRRLREIGGTEAKEIAIFYLDHKSEDMVVSAIQTATKLWGGDDRYSSSRSSKVKEPNKVTEKVIGLLSDPRWRVRTAALEFVSKTRARAAEEEVIALLSDEDSFVRSNAIDAVVALELKSAIESLEKLFLEDEEMIGPVTAAITSLGTPLPDRLVAHLDASSPDAIIAAIKGLDSDKEPYLKQVARYATHQNLDVACTALRALGDDPDKVRQDFVADRLSEALESGVAEKLTAVLNSLRYPSPRNSSSFGFSREFQAPSKPTSLDHLYDSFLKTVSAKEEIQPESIPEPKASGGKAGLRAILATIAENWDENPKRAYRAAYILARADDSDGLQSLSDHFEKLSTSQRAAVADNLYSPQNDKAIPLLMRLMQDDVSEVRADAAYTAFGSSNNPDLIEKGLAQLTVENTKLTAHEAYCYGIESAAAQSGSSSKIIAWAREILTSQSRDDNKILALILLRQHLREGDDLAVTPYTRSENQWLRRAAWNALCTTRQPWVIENVGKLKADPSPQVRIALPMTLAGSDSRSWRHQFTDLHTKSDSSSSYSFSSSSSSRRTRLPSDLEETLRTLAEGDPDPGVRFESWFALMGHRKDINLKAFLALIGEQPEDSRVGYRLANHIERDFKSMGKAMRPLLAFATMKAISKSKLPSIFKHFASDEEGASFTSFEALAKSTEASEGPQQLEGVETPEELARKRRNLRVIAFYKPGCRECERAEKALDALKQLFPLLEVERLNINGDGLIINQILCARLKVSGVGKTPSFFTQAGAAISPNVKPEQLSDLLKATMEIEDDPTWVDFGTVEVEDAKESINDSFSNVTLAIVIFGGLLDGINPCAFATIIFFLSYLQVAKRTPREILMVGISFISAIFIAYFAVGLIFHAAIESLVQLEGFQLARVIMTWVFAFFAFLVAVLSLRDGIRASRGSIGEMTLQLPDFLKNRIRGAIRKRARARNYVIAAFITGIVISLLELACTGQVYAPIVYQIQQGRSDAMLYLLIYNIAFILPLVVIFILAYRGMTSDALVRFQKNHTAAVKYATAILFFILTLVILFGDKLIPHG
ncbi:MAG: HEAT repeat protein/cytochrome c biogenesis protein CcdA [Akkermansiaceae bacterium]|jgi:HEAT repeat protein/cytochrome c biogenesis protein CcdA